ncbi:MAG: trigger factor family protein [Candidatus Dojkabacteria bacterium]|nr:MAG: trigger factor family protein [Candidatus Dojkabacteria bacterium]
MAALLQTDTPNKIIQSKKVLKEENGTIEYEVRINEALQKDVYEKLFAEKAKEIEMKGFRKGEAPRSMVESQIYNDVTNNMVNALINNAVGELLEEEKITVILMPEVTNITFTVIETPIAFVVKIQPIKDYALPDMKKHQIEIGDLAPAEKEIDDAMKSVWEEWNKRAKDEDKAQYTEMSDTWVETQLNVPNVTTIAGLRDMVKEELEHSKLHEVEDQKISEALKAIIESMKIEVPAEFVSKNVEQSITQQKERLTKGGSSWDAYLTQYKKTEDEIKSDLTELYSQQYREEVFWRIFIKTRKIEIDPANKEDATLINYAAANIGARPEDKLSQEAVERILRTATMYKALRTLREELGLKEHDHHHHDHDDAGDVAHSH